MATKRKPVNDNKQSKLNVEQVYMDSIKPHPKNARVHDDSNIQSIMKSLETYGQRTPLVVGKNNHILKGCGTWESMRRLGWETCQVIKTTGLSEEEELGYALADNKTGDLSDFDYEGVAGILQHLHGKDFDLEKTGFRNFEFEPLLTVEYQAPGESAMPELVSKYKLTFSEEQAEIIQAAIDIAREEGISPQKSRDEDTVTSIARAVMDLMLVYKAKDAINVLLTGLNSGRTQTAKPNQANKSKSKRRKVT